MGIFGLLVVYGAICEVFTDTDIDTDTDTDTDIDTDI